MSPVRPLGPVRSTLLLWLALIAAVLATLIEAARAAAAHQATRAAAALAADQPVPALQAADAALAWYPWQEPAQFSQLAAGKRLGMWDRLAHQAAAARLWHPDQTLLLQLAGEAAWHRGEHAAAAAGFWGALWRTPYPPRTPAQVWRMAAEEGREAWGAADPRVAAAAVRTLSLLDRDATMTDPAIRRAAVADAAAALRAAGAPLSAETAAQSPLP